MADALVERDGHLMVVTMNRPHRKNAQTVEMLARLYDAWIEANEDDDIRCVIITGAEGCFSSGNDLRVMAGDASDIDAEIDAKARLAAEPRLHYKAYLKEYVLRKPLIAAVEGVCIAGGAELMLAADIRVAGASARFAIAEARWSLYPMMGGVVRLPRTVPRTVAAEMLLTGKQIDAGEAHRWGLVGSVVADGTTLDAARVIADQICANGPLAVEAILRTLRETNGMPLDAALSHENGYGRAIFETEDAREGPAAFAAKRQPTFIRR